MSDEKDDDVDSSDALDEKDDEDDDDCDAADENDDCELKDPCDMGSCIDGAAIVGDAVALIVRIDGDDWCGRDNGGWSFGCDMCDSEDDLFRVDILLVA